MQSRSLNIPIFSSLISNISTLLITLKTSKIRITFLDYIGQTLFIHLVTVACLTAWLIFLVGLDFEQYTTWLWQSTLLAFGFNYFLYLCLRWFVPKWHKRIGMIKDD